MTHRTIRLHRELSPFSRVLTLVVGLALALTACGGGGQDVVDIPAGILRDPAPDVSDVVLPDAADNDAPFATKAAPGEILLVYFGFTACPDVCPTTLADVRSAIGELDEEQAERVALAMITVDPDRDTAEALTAYTTSFVARAHALRTDDPDRLAQAADAYGAVYDVTTNDEGLVEVGHTAFLYAVDWEGRVRITWPFGTPPEDLTRDMQWLFDQGVG